MKKEYNTIVSWTLTYKCQEKCGYCFSPKPRKELGKEEHFKIQEKLIENKTTGNYYVGGEVLLIPYLPELIALAHDNGIDTRLSTNGILLSLELLNMLKSNLNQIALPFDSLDDDINEKVRGNRLHRKMISSRIKMIKEIAPDIELQINTCVNKQNIKFLEELGNFLHEQEINRWKIRRFYPIAGNAKKNREHFEISDDEYNESLQSLKKKFPQFNIDKKIPADLALRLMISPKGDLYRMSKHGEEEDFIFGNILHDNLDIKKIAKQEKSK